MRVRVKQTYVHEHCTILEDFRNKIACVTGAWKECAQERTGAREGDARGESEPDGVATGSRGDVFVIRTSKPAENL